MPTILHRLSSWAEESPDSVAQKHLENGKWQDITARTFLDHVFYLACFLESRGFTRKDIVAIFSYNCPQWVHMDLAPHLLGGKSAGLYPNANREGIHFILNHTCAKVVAVQNEEYYLRITGEKNQEPLPDFVELIVVFQGNSDFSPKAVAYDDAIALGRELAAGKRFADYLGNVNPEEGAFLIYTSGTTGAPKGVLLSHDNMVFATDSIIEFWNLPAHSAGMFSFLPLCHIAEKIQNVGVSISKRYTVYYGSRFENLAAELALVQPTLVLCVPRLWEKFMEAVSAKIESAPWPKRRLGKWALGVGARVAAAKFAGKKPGLLDGIQHQLAEALVLSKIKLALGLSKAELCASGAAALSPRTAKWFRSLGLELLEDYGQTETTAVVCMTQPGVDSLGAVGIPLPQVEFKLAADGEILTKGRHVFKGYFKNQAATDEAFLDGWLCTGDLAEIDERGLVRIIGRKKELINTSGGKLLAPIPIEERLKQFPAINQVCLIGDDRRYITALITIPQQTLENLQHKTGAIHDDIVTDADLLNQIQLCVDAVNKTLVRYEEIKYFKVPARDFSIAEGEMTPTMKMKRKVIESRFKDLIDQMY